MVYQGLCDIVLTVFFENNHGKYIADGLFGQLQRIRLRSNIVAIDALLAEFEKVKKRRGGEVSGFVVHPVSTCRCFSVFGIRREVAMFLFIHLAQHALLCSE